MRGFSIKFATITKIMNGELPMTTPVGNAKDVHGNFLTVFLRTDPETGEVVKNKRGDGVMFNLRASLPRG